MLQDFILALEFCKCGSVGQGSMHRSREDMHNMHAPVLVTPFSGSICDAPGAQNYGEPMTRGRSARLRVNTRLHLVLSNLGILTAPRVYVFILNQNVL